jgi:hypothetical protein
MVVVVFFNRFDNNRNNYIKILARIIVKSSSEISDILNKFIYFLVLSFHTTDVLYSGECSQNNRFCLLLSLRKFQTLNTVGDQVYQHKQCKIIE